MDKIEKVLYNFTNLIPEIRDLPYSDRLKLLKISSMQRRYDRYKIFYIQKILNNSVPNVGISIEHNTMHRNGLSLWVPSRKASNLRNNSFQSVGPRIFNLLPKEIRNHTGSMESFKEMYDDFLSMIPDVPRLGMGSMLYSNTLEHQLSNWRWRIYTQSYNLE